MATEKSVAGADDTSGQSRARGRSAETEEPQLNESSSTANSVNTQQVLVEDLTVLPAGSRTPASLSKPSSAAPNVSETHKMVTSLFPEGGIVHSFYHCTGSKCRYQKEKGRKKFDHAWIFRRDIS